LGNFIKVFRYLGAEYINSEWGLTRITAGKTRDDGLQTILSYESRASAKEKKPCLPIDRTGQIQLQL